MSLFPGEAEAIERVLELGKNYGYGNMIAHLKRAWIEKLIEIGLPKETALLSVNVDHYPVKEE